MSEIDVRVARPRRIVFYGAIAATVVLGAMIVVGVLLKRSDVGVSFRLFDQLGLIAVGVFGAGAIMLVARPRLRADERGLAVRNILGEILIPWEQVVRIAFPPGAHWARVILPDDETYPVLAIQALDKQRAVEDLRAVRALQERYQPRGVAVVEEEKAKARRRARAEAAAAAARPLGRLEVIDRKLAQEGGGGRRGRRR